MARHCRGNEGVDLEGTHKKFLTFTEHLETGDAEGWETRVSPLPAPQLPLLRVRFLLQNPSTRNYPEALRIYKNADVLPPISFLEVTSARAPRQDPRSFTTLPPPTASPQTLMRLLS